MNGARTRRSSALWAAVLAVAGSVVLAGPADAAHIGCGTVITRSTTLHNDIGPCTGDGLQVRTKAKKIVLDLNGHTIWGTHEGATADTPEHVGVRLMGASGVTVKDGTVRGFEAGVAVMGGSGNTVTGLVVHDNINALRPDLPNGDPAPCDFGDGITAVNSDGNTISGNRVFHNGPYSGISLVGDSDGNVVANNDVSNNDVSNVRPDGSTGPCGAPMTRARQDIGIRIEGPGADQNVIEANSVSGNQLAGITIHGYVCNQGANNGGNLIKSNNVVGNGYADVTESGDGIAVLQQGPAGVVCVAHGNAIVRNTSTDNAQDGIFLGGRGTRGNTIDGNTVLRNGRDGIHVNEGAEENTLTANVGSDNGKSLLVVGFDGFDGNVNCGSNAWTANKFVKVNQPCVSSP